MKLRISKFTKLSLEAAPRFQFLLKMKNPNFRWDLKEAY